MKGVFCPCILILLSLVTPASAQNATGLVVSSCGTVPAKFGTGVPAPFTVDTNGQMCFGAAGTISASSVNGAPTMTGLGVGTCGSVTFKAGNPGPFTVDQYGNVCK